MKKTIFIASHLGSNSVTLVESLSENSCLQFFDHESYMDLSDIQILHESEHKLDTTAAVYASHLLFNTNIYWKPAFELFKFIYIINDSNSLGRIAALPGYTPQTACDYYCFRLQRIYRMLKQTKNYLFFHNELNLNKVNSFLKLEASELQESEMSEVKIPFHLKEKAQDCYERYLLKINQVSSNPLH